ncbi:MAG: type II secretion system secretin GspD [Pseudomonadota bacterium]
MLLAVAYPAAAAVTLNLKDADINSLIATVSEVTGKNFIVDPRVKGKVTVVSSRPMSPAGVYATFLAVLQVQGFAAVPAGQAIKIVPETNARTDGGVPNASGSGLPIDGVVTHVYQVENISAAQLVPILRPLIPQWGHLAAYPSSNMLIISDRAANVVRIEQLIKQMDQTGDREIEVVRLVNASAPEVVRTLTSLTQQDKQADPGSRAPAVIADERTNSVLLGGEKSDRQKMLSIITKLDATPTEGGSTQVVYLRYASADSLAPILQGYAQQASKSSTSSSSSSSGAAATSAPVSSSSGGGGTEGVKVLAEKDSNALVITAAPKMMRQIRDVISQLDIERAQILVEAVIAEVSANKASQLGVDWAVFNQNRIAAASILNPDTLSALGTAVGSGSDTAYLGLIGQGINIGGGVLSSGGTSLALLIKALKTDGDTNVLSTPTLVTMDNQEAKFSAGQEVPFLSGSFSNTGTGSNNGSVNPFQTIERKDVGLTLGVTPQINADNRVKLKLNLEVSGIASGSAGSSNLITNKRTLTNTVGVENGQILVIGGLIQDQITDSKSGVPFLSSIPFIGSLFQYRSVSKTKQNLMLFIRPSILRKQSDGDYYTRRKYDAVREAQIHANVGGAVPLIGGSRPVLETFENYLKHVPPVVEAPAAAAPQVQAAPAPEVTAPTAPASPDAAQP